MTSEQLMELSGDYEPRDILVVEPKEFEKFVLFSFQGVAREMVKGNLGMQDVNKVERDLLVKNPAQALSAIPAGDENLHFPNAIGNLTHENVSLMVPLALAKADYAKDKLPEVTPREKNAFNKFINRVLAFAGALTGGFGGAKGRLALAGLMLTVSACGGGRVASKSAAPGVELEDPSSEILVSSKPPVGCPKDEMGLNMEGYTFQDTWGLVWRCDGRGWQVDTEAILQKITNDLQFVLK